MKNISTLIRSTKEEVTNRILIGMIAVLGIMIALVVAFTFAVKTSYAGPGYPFGGQITSVIYCTCTANYAVYFNDLTVTSATGGLPLIYEPGVTDTYLFYMQTTPGSWILGTWVAGGVCLTGKFCPEIPTAGTMYMVGSSM